MARDVGSADAGDSGGDRPRSRSAKLAVRISLLAVAAVVAFVTATATGSAAAEEWTGIAALLAILSLVAWLAVVSSHARTRWAPPQLSMAGALAVLVSGTIAGAIAAGDAANGNATGAASLATAHSAVLVVPFVMLAATGVLEWSALRPAQDPLPVSTASLVQVGALVLAAAAVLAGVLGNNLALVEANIPLELGGIAIFLVRVGPVLLTADWSKGSRIWLVTGTVSLAVDAGLFAHVVFEIGTRRYVSVDMVPRWLLFTVDHVTFVAVGTTALLGAIAVMAAGTAGNLRWPRTDARQRPAWSSGSPGRRLASARTRRPSKPRPPRCSASRCSQQS